MNNIIEKCTEILTKIRQAAEARFSDFCYWYDDQDENTQNLVILAIMIVLYLSWRSIIA